jgi:hypothetical protein
MWRRMCALVVALLAIPALSAAQEVPYKFDEQKIVECLPTAYGQAIRTAGRTLTIEETIARKCTRLEYDACMKVQDSTWSVSKMFCEAMEAQVWDRLLQTQYDRAVAAKHMTPGRPSSMHNAPTRAPKSARARCVSTGRRAACWSSFPRGRCSTGRSPIPLNTSPRSGDRSGRRSRGRKVPPKLRKVRVSAISEALGAPG